MLILNTRAFVVMLVYISISYLNRLLKYFIFSGCRFNYRFCAMLHIKFLCRTFNRYTCMYELNCVQELFYIYFLIKILRFPELSVTLFFYYCRCCITGISGNSMMFTPLFYSFCIILSVCTVNVIAPHGSVTGIFYSLPFTSDIYIWKSFTWPAY